MHSASVTIACKDAAEASVLHGAVAVEANDGPEGSNASLEVNGESLQLTVEAGDLSTLRAALHGVLRLLDAARRTE